MATRRIQPSVPGQEATQVVASPVNTFVSPGAAGMPAAPLGRIEPTPPDLQEARDLENLAKAFGSLSGALSDLGKANAMMDRLDRPKQQESMSEARRLGREASEAVDINPLLEGRKTLSQISVEMNKLLEEGQITATQLPHFNKAFALALGERIARDTGSKARIEFANLLATDENAARNPKLVDRFLGGLNEMGITDIPDWLGDQDAYAAAYLNQAAKDRAWFEATHSEWLVKDQRTTETQNLTYSTNEIMDEVLSTLQGEAQKDVILFSPGTLQFDRAKNTSADTDFTEVAAGQITQMLDGKFGNSIMSPDDRNTIVGQALVDYAVNTPDIELKKQALEVFKKVKTGPEDGRGLLSKKGPVDEYFKKNEARILNAIDAAEVQAERDRLVAEKEARDLAEAEATKAWDMSRKTSLTNMTQHLGGMLKLRGGSYNSVGGMVDEVRATLRTGSVSNPIVRFVQASNGKIEGSDIVFTNPINERETRVSVESVVREAVAATQNDLYRKELAIVTAQSLNEADPTYRTFDAGGNSVPLDEGTLQLIAQVRATKELGVYENNIVRDQMRDAIILQSNTEFGVNPRVLYGATMAFREMTVGQRGSHQLARTVLGNMYDVYQTIDDLTWMAQFGGGGMSGMQRIAETLSKGALSQEAINSSYTVHKDNLVMMTADEDINAIASEFDSPPAFKARLQRMTGLYLHLAGSAPSREDTVAAARQVAEGIKKSQLPVKLHKDRGGVKYVDISQIDPRYVMGEHPDLDVPLQKLMTTAQTGIAGGEAPIVRRFKLVPDLPAVGSLTLEQRKKVEQAIPEVGPLTEPQTRAKAVRDLYRSIVANVPDQAFLQQHPPYFVPSQATPNSPLTFRLYVPFNTALESTGVGYRMLTRGAGAVDFSLDDLKMLQFLEPLPVQMPVAPGSPRSSYQPSNLPGFKY